MQNPEHADLPQLLETALARAGSLRSVWCAPSLTFATTVTQRRGILLGGAFAPQFIRNPDSVLQRTPFVRTLAQPRILRMNRVEGTLADWLPFLEAVAKGGHSLLVVAETVDEELLQTFVVNSLRGTLDLCAIRPGRSLGDIRVLGPLLDRIPLDVDALPPLKASWTKRSATIAFLESPDDRATTEMISVIEVGGEDFEDQLDRLRLMSSLIRDRERQGV